MLKLLLAYFLVALVICWPALPYLGDRYLGGASLDAGLYIYLCQSALDALLTDDWFSTRSFYPYGLSLAWSDNFILPAVFFKLLTIFLGKVIAFNTLILTALTLNGCAFYFLASKLNIKKNGAHFFGLSSACFAYFTSQLGHPQILFFFFIPLGLGLLIDLFRKPGFSTLVFLGGVVFTCFLTTVYYAVFIALLVAVFCPFILIRHSKQVWSSISLWQIILLSLFIPAFLVFAWPYLQVKAAFGPRYLYEAGAFALKPAALLSPSNNSLLYSNLSSGNPESQFFPGWAIIFITLLGLIRLPGDKKFLFVHWMCLLIFIVSSCWPELFSNLGQICLRYLLLLSSLPLIFRPVDSNHEASASSALKGILLLCAAIFLILASGPIALEESKTLDPFVLLFKYFPGVEALRAVARYALVSLLIYYLLAISSLCQLTLRKWQLILILAFVLIENIPARIPIEEPIAAPKVLEHLPPVKKYELSSIVALPMATRFDNLKQPASWTEYSRLNVSYMNWFHDSDYHLVNGYSGQRSRIIKEFPEKLHEFPDLRSITALQHIGGLRYILYNGNENPKFNRKKFEERLSHFESSLTLVKEEHGSYLFELSPKVGSLNQIYLMIPAYLNLKLQLELQIDGSCSPNKTTTLTILDSATTKSQLFPIAIGELASLSINFTRHNENVISPRKISFATPENCDIDLITHRLIKDSRF
jgi:hypothetical protein